MKAKLKNGSIVTGRLAEIFVSRKVADWMPEEQETLEEVEQDIEPVIAQIKPIVAKVSVKDKTKVLAKKAGRPKVKK